MQQADLSDKLRRNRAFWQRAEVERPLLGVTTTYFPREALAATAPRSGALSPGDVDIPALLAACDAEYAARQALMGDLFWAAGTLTGFPWLHAMLGCPVYRSPDTFWTEPILADYADLPRLQLSAENAWLCKLVEVTLALVEHGQGRYSVGPTLYLSPVTLASALRGADRFALDLYDYPQEVERLLQVCTDVCIQAQQAQIDRLPRFHGGAVNPARHVWAPGWPVETHEDDAFMFSPRMHRRFLLTPQQQLGRAFDYAYIHLHGKQLHTLDALLELDELACIEITADVGQSAVDLLPAIQKSLARRPVLVHGYISLAEMRELWRALPARGLCLATRTDTPEEAAEMVEGLTLNA